MTKEQGKKYEELSNKRNQLERFLKQEGPVGISYWGSYSKKTCCTCVYDDKFERQVRELAVTRLKEIEAEIEAL